MPTFPFLRPAGQVETPNRVSLRNRLGVDSLPPISALSEELAGTITNEQFKQQFCQLRVGGDLAEANRTRPWCNGFFIPVNEPAPAPPAPPPSVDPLTPGYASGRPPPAQHYATWPGLAYILGDEKSFLLSLPPDDYYRLVDKLNLGPAAFHQAVRIEATRRHVADPLGDMVIPVQIVPQPTPRSHFPWLIAIVVVGGGLYMLGRRHSKS